MKSNRIHQAASLFAGVIMLIAGTGVTRALEAAAPTAPVTMTVTPSVAADKRMPELSRGDIVVRQDWARVRG